MRGLLTLVAGGWLVNAGCDASAGPRARAAEQPPRVASAGPPASLRVAATPDGGASADTDRGQPPAPTGPAPLSPEQRATLERVRAERIFVTPPLHFTASNEYRHALWFPFVQGLGGAYVGVASDQNYTLLAAARSEVAFIVDIDRKVVDLHQIYAALIAAAPEPAGFLALFEPGAGEAARQAIAAGLAHQPRDQQGRVQALFAGERAALAVYLQRVRDQQIGSWLADPAAYTYVREMFAAGRIRVLQGNLTGKTTMADIAAATRALALPVTVLYLSNAEDYLFYTDRFAANVAALPSSPRSALLRTIHDRFPTWESAGEGDPRWHYQVQALPDFQRRLGDRSHGRNQDRASMLTTAVAVGAVERKSRGLSTIALNTTEPAGEGDLLIARADEAAAPRRD
ncbi:LIC_10091 family protein [Nannocystis bainbridge]|uniref:LIC_10091 family protein n=1 Tax=Nannocystis bainbridge TaxID=2995303 RepID=UPI0040330760